MDEVLKKVCSKCGEEKDIIFFGKQKGGKYGKRGKCKACFKLYNIENKEYVRIYKIKNKEKLRIRDKKYYSQNKERFKERHKKNSKKHYSQNKEKIIQRQKNRLTNPELRIRNCIISGHNHSFNKLANKPKCSMYKYTGISIDNYISHFKNSEYWEDYKNNLKISIDHIIPVSLYDFRNENDIKKCWDIRNLRLVPLIENMRKGNTIDYDLIKKHNIEDLMPGI